MITLQDYYAFGSGGSPAPVWPPTQPREPLPPDPGATGTQPGPPEASCWSSNGDYIRTEPSNIPTAPDRRWHRGNFCGVRVPGYTSSSCLDKSLLFTWELTDNSDDQMRLAIDYYVDVCGYTHLVLSRPQTMNQGRTLADLIRVALYAKSRGLFVIIVAVSDGAPFADAIPWLEACLAAGCLDIVCFAWQADKWYQPEEIVQGIIDNGEWSHPRQLLTTTHWGGGYPGWAESCACWDAVTYVQWGISDRFSFQRVLAPYLDGHYGQCNTEAPIDAVQSWLFKCFIAMPPPMFLVSSEEDAEAEYDEPYQRLERYGDQKGLLATFSSPDGRVSYLNGARRSNGRVW